MKEIKATRRNFLKLFLSLVSITIFPFKNKNYFFNFKKSNIHWILKKGD